MASEHLARKVQSRSALRFKLGVAAFGFAVALAVLLLLTRLGNTCPISGSDLQHGLSDSLHGTVPPVGLEFMLGKTVLLVSHELTLSGGPLLLMELAVLLRNAGSKVQWITINQRETGGGEVTRSLESKLREKGIQIVPAKGTEAVKAANDADLVVLNTAVAGKWIDSSLKDDYERVLPKVLWWIHEMRGHYFTLDYVKHLPQVAGVMIDSHATADYWRNRTQQRLGVKMPKVFVVHLGNSKELTEAAENTLARTLLRQHVRETLGISNKDVMFSAINSVSRGKGQDLFLKAFFQAVKQVDSRESRLHAVIVGSDWVGQPKFEAELRELVRKNNAEGAVHFVNKTMNVVPYLAATDVLVQNSQARGECFGRISIEAMAFKLPILGTAAGGTTEIVVDGSTGLLHPAGKEGVPLLAANMVKLYQSFPVRVSMGQAGYRRVKERFMEQHMSERIGSVLKEILRES